MIMICIDNENAEDYLTVGKSYSGLIVSGKGEERDMFRVDASDEGTTILFNTYRFAIAELE